jgi:hypothetical protein
MSIVERTLGQRIATKYFLPGDGAHVGLAALIDAAIAEAGKRHRQALEQCAAPFTLTHLDNLKTFDDAMAEMVRRQQIAAEALNSQQSGES